MTDTLKELVAKLERAYSDRLVSVVLYGSGASDDHNHKFSDLNVLCVLTRVTPAELGASEPIFKWWRDGNPSPLLLSEDSVPLSRCRKASLRKPICVRLSIRNRSRRRLPCCCLKMP